MTDTTPPRPDDVDVTDEAPPQPPMITAEGLDFGTGDSRIFARLDFAIPAGELAVIIGPAGAGKSVLLAGLVGRFKGFDGRLEVAGFDADKQSRHLRKITTAARIGSFVDLEPQHSINNAVAERAAIDGLSMARASTAYDRLATELEVDLEPGRLIGSLDGYHRTALNVVLAMLKPSKVLVVDDLHRDLNIDDQRLLLGRLTDLAVRTSTTIVVSTVEATTIPYEAVRVSIPAPGTPTTSSR